MLSAAQRDELLVRLDERTERMDKVLTKHDRAVDRLLQAQARLDTEVGGLKSRERWAMARSIVLAACTAVGLKVAVGA